MNEIETIFDGEVDQEYQPLSVLFKSAVMSNPDAISLKFGIKKYTYIQLYDEVNKCINNFEAVGLKKSDIIGLHVERSDRYALIALAIMIGGYVYLPLAVELPEQRLQEIIDIAKPDLIVSDAIRNLLGGSKLLSSDELLKENHSEHNQNLSILPTALCYIIFTSGTEGKPKGVKIAHESFFNRLIWAKEYYSLECNDVILCKTPFTFDPSIQELILPIISGACLLMADPKKQAYPGYLIECILEHHVTMMIVVPSLLRLLIQSSKFSMCDSLRHIVCCGEPWGAELVTAFYKICKNGSIYNGYGPTEATIGTLVYCPSRDYQDSYIPIGRPIKGAHVGLVNESGNSVVPGDVGELIIGGICVGVGYVNDAKLTESKFKTLCVKNRGEMRFYFSGDLAKQLPNGDILFLGRKDNQIKINGVRVELEEIENILKQHEAIKDAIVLKVKGSSADYLHAFFISNIEGLDVKTLKQHCLNKLNYQTSPSHYTQLSEFPLTQNGKTDRKKIAERVLQA